MPKITQLESEMPFELSLSDLQAQTLDLWLPSPSEGRSCPEAKWDKPACLPIPAKSAPSACHRPQNPTLQSDSPSRSVWFGWDLGGGGVSAMLTPDHPGLNWLPQDLRNPGAALVNRPVGEALRGDAHQRSGSRVRAPKHS